MLPKAAAHWLLTLADSVRRTGQPVGARAVWAGRRYKMAVLSTDAADGDVVVIARPSPRLETEVQDDSTLRAPFVDLGPLFVLTRRELEVLALLGEGLGLGDIADLFDRSIKTVKRFRDGIAQKLGVGDRTRLGMIARDLGLERAHVDLPKLEFKSAEPIGLETIVPRLTMPADIPGRPQPSVLPAPIDQITPQ
ncbi:MAG: LuxR C-terminal-related transcriptional regulator [Planctomycetota bacterium]